MSLTTKADDTRHKPRSSSSRSRSRSRSRGRMNRSPVGSSFKDRRYSRDSPPAKVRRPSRRSPSPPPKQTKYGGRDGRRSRSYSPRNYGQPSSSSYDRRSRSPARGYQDRPSGRSSPKNYRDQSPDYYQKPKDLPISGHGDSQHMPTYVVVNRDRSYTPEKRQAQDRHHYDDRRNESRDLDARLREMEVTAPEMTKPRVYVKDDYSRNSPRDQYGQGSTYEKNSQGPVVEYRRDNKSPDSKYRRESRDYRETSRKDSFNDNNQGDRAYSPPRREKREHRRNDSPYERKKSKDAKYTRSPERYQSPEPERSSYREDDQRRDRHDRDRREIDNNDRGRQDEEKYTEKKVRSGRDRSNHGSSSRDAYDSKKSHRRQDNTNDKSRQDRGEERGRHSPTFDPTLVIVPRRKDEGRGGIFNRPEITLRPVTDDPDNQPMPFEEKRVVAVMPGKQLPPPAVSDRDLRRDYVELLARKGIAASTSSDFEVRRDKYGDLGLDSPQTLSSRFQGASSLDLLATLENFEINRTKHLERELELRREMDYLRERSPLHLSDSHTDLQTRFNLIERKVEPKNPRDLRHDLESRRKQLKAGRVDTAVSPRRSVTKKVDKDSKLRMTSADRRPVRERLGLSPGKREQRSFNRRDVQEREELPDFKKEVEELQKAQWMEDPKSVPKGSGYFEHDDRERSDDFQGGFIRGRGTRRGRGLGFRGRISTRGRGSFFRGSFRGGFGRGGYSTRFRGLGRGRGISFRGRGRSSPPWKHDKFDGNGKEKKLDQKDERGGSSKPKLGRRDLSGSRMDDKHSSRKDDRKPRDSRDRRSDRPRDSRAREPRDSRKDRR